jgi:hypothetical protein
VASAETGELTTALAAWGGRNSRGLLLVSDGDRDTRRPDSAPRAGLEPAAYSLGGSFPSNHAVRTVTPGRTVYGSTMRVEAPEAPNRNSSPYGFRCQSTVPRKSHAGSGGYGTQSADVSLHHIEGGPIYPVHVRVRGCVTCVTSPSSATDRRRRSKCPPTEGHLSASVPFGVASEGRARTGRYSPARARVSARRSARSRGSPSRCMPILSVT